MNAWKELEDKIKNLDDYYNDLIPAIRSMLNNDGYKKLSEAIDKEKIKKSDTLLYKALEIECGKDVRRH